MYSCIGCTEKKPHVFLSVETSPHRESCQYSQQGGGWVDIRASLDMAEKIQIPDNAGNHSSTNQHIASHCLIMYYPCLLGTMDTNHLHNIHFLFTTVNTELKVRIG